MARDFAPIAAWLLLAATAALPSSAEECPNAEARDCPICPPCQPQGGIFEECCPDCRWTRVYRSEILGRLWIRGDYLLWGMKQQHTDPLIAASPVGTPLQDTGVLGFPTTNVLFGDRDLSASLRSGGRLTGGYWWTPEQTDGIEASYFELDDAEAEGLFASPGNPLIAVPFRSPATGFGAAAPVAYPGLFDGGIGVRVSSALNGAELLLRHNLVCGPSQRVDVVGGYRYLRLADHLDVNQLQTALDPATGFDPGTLIDRFDSFETVNHFHGAEMGIVSRWWRNYLAFEVQGKLALGGTQTTTTIDGATLIQNQTFATAYPGGLFALPSNMGTFDNSRFAAVGQLSVALELSLTCSLRASVGYDLLYWSSVGRGLDQVDRVINPSQIPPSALVGPSRPEYVLRSTDFWAQGLTLGLVYQF